jgi:hypothetical protein
MRNEETPMHEIVISYMLLILLIIAAIGSSYGFYLFLKAVL